MKIKIIDFGADKLPVRKHYNDAGADVYCPQTYILNPGETIAVPLGFGVEIPDGFMGLIFVRSGMAQTGFDCKLPPIDSGYRGEIHAVVSNTSTTGKALTKGMRIGQLVILPIVIADFVRELGDERGAGAFGSTGK